MEDIYDTMANMELDDNENKYISGVSHIPSNLAIRSLVDFWKNNDLRIPIFQRRFVWTLPQASLFIESLLSDLPIPTLIFYKDYAEYQYIIDGQQRTKSILYYIGAMEEKDIGVKDRKFLNFRLTGLSDESPYYNKTFSELDSPIQRKLLNRTLPITMVSLKDSNDLTNIYEIFRRLNTGGTPLTAQEIRNCICAGNFNDFLVELNQYNKWQSFISSDLDKKRQKDVELILRFFALYDSIDNYKKPMKDFLTLYFKNHRNINDDEKEQKKVLFINIVDAIDAYLDEEKPFHGKNGLNSSIADALMIAFSHNLDNIPNDIKSRYYNLMNNEVFYSYVSKSPGDVKSIYSRISIAEKVLFSEIGENEHKIVKLFDIPVSAGAGNWIDDNSIPYEEITVVNRRADFALRIRGDSMSPKINNGDIVLVKKQNVISTSQIGIFTYKNEVFCKKYIKSKAIYLSSINTFYKTKKITELDNFFVNGLVVDILSSKSYSL